MPLTVPCPVKGDEINGDDCIIVCDVADGMIKPTVLPEGIELNEEQRKKCKQCKYHADITPGKPRVVGVEAPAMNGYFVMERHLEDK